jgi:hypothetical protein
LNSNRRRNGRRKTEKGKNSKKVEEEDELEDEEFLGFVSVQRRRKKSAFSNDLESTMSNSLS